MGHPERGTEVEEVPEWGGWTSSGCPRQPPRCGRCCCQRSSRHPPSEKRCPMLCSGECGSWAWWSRQRRNSHSFSGHKGYFLKPAQGAPEFPPSCLVCADLPDASSGALSNVLTRREHLHALLGLGLQPLHQPHTCSSLNPGWKLGPGPTHPQPRSRMEGMLRRDGIRQAANTTWRVPQRSEGTATSNGTKCQFHRHFCWTSPA